MEATRSYVYLVDPNQGNLNTKPKIAFGIFASTGAPTAQSPNIFSQILVYQKLRE